MTIPATYEGQALLVRWGETSTAGRTVTFQIEEGPDASPLHPFKGFRAGKDGDRFLIMCVPIGNDEQPISEIAASRESTIPPGAGIGSPPESAASSAPAASPKERRPFHMLPLATQAAIRCQDATFIAWLKLDDPTPETAAEVVRAYCGVDSRSQLSGHPIAAAKWRAMNERFLIETGQMPDPRQ